MLDHNQFERSIQCLEEAKTREPELSSCYQFYHNIFHLQFEAKNNISFELSMIDDDLLRERSQQGLSQITFKHLPVEADTFNKLAIEIVHVVLDYQEVDHGEYAFEDIDWVGLARDRYYQAPKQNQSEPSALAAEMATTPYLEWVSEQIIPHMEGFNWNRGRCPICGGEPNFAFLEKEEGNRWLVCSRCRTEWVFVRLRCPFCKNSDPEKMRYFPAGENNIYRLYVCDACSRYLKAIDLRKAKNGPLLLVEPVLTWSLDRAAKEMGYH